MHQAWQQYGSLPWRDLLLPAHQLANEGFELWNDLAVVLNKASSVLGHYSSDSAYLKKDGQPWLAGDVLIQKDLAWSIAQIMEHGADAFYKGELAARILKAFEKAGGIISKEDLAAYTLFDTGTGFRIT